MKNVTRQVLRFRSVLHTLWNAYCWNSEDLRNLETADEFGNSLTLPLYNFFVFQEVCDLPPAKNMFGRAFTLVPFERPGGSRADSLSMRLNYGNNVWMPEVHRINHLEIKFELTDFFDWRWFYWRDYTYYRFKITRWDAEPDKVGLEGLVLVNDVDVWFDETVAEADANFGPTPVTG